jgi:hypothetical protein
MRKINLLLLSILFLLTVWAGKGIFKYNVYSTHDGDHHLARSFDVLATAQEGHFPLRWAGTLNYGCGVPIYNFFYPLLYYLVVFSHPFTQNIFLSLKLISFLALLVGTLFFYLWLKSETGNKLASFAGAVLYLYAPYRFLLIFVRGSPEYLAYALLPVVLYFFCLTFKAKDGRKFLLLAFGAAFTGGLLTIAHNFTVMFVMPLILLHLLIKIRQTKIEIKKVLTILFAYLSAFGLGAFFIFPAFLERKYTKIGTSFLEWREHFPTLKQVLRSPWGYFYSSPGTQNDGMSFQLGYAHWLVLGLVAAWLIWQLSKKRKIDWQIWFFGAISVGSLFLVLPYSQPVWEVIPILQAIQFSWRLLGIAVFSISALFAFWLAKMPNKKVFFVLLFLVSALAFIGNRNHLLPQPISVEDVYRYDDFERLHPHRYSTTTLGDDVLAPSAPGRCWFTTKPVASEIQEEIPYKLLEKKSTSGAVNFSLEKDNLKGQKVVLGLGYFPGMFRIEANGKNVPYEDCQGQVCLDKEIFQTGPNHIFWQVQQTPIQNIFNYLTLLFLAVWMVILFFGITKIKPKVWHFILIAVFLVFSYLRFYHLPQRVSFGWDEERDARAVAEILQGDLKLIGPRVLSDTGFFLPPYFFYLLAPFYALAKSSPYAVVYFLVFYNLVFFMTAFWILKRLFNQKVALLFLVFWAINPQTLSFDTVAWNPVLVPLLFLLLIYALSVSKFFLAGIVWGLGMSAHFQFLLLAPLFWPFVHKNRRYFLSLLTGFGLTILPLVIFDFRNDFLNLRLIGKFLSSGGAKNYLAFLPVWDNVVARTLGLPVSRFASLIFYLAVVAILFMRKEKPIFKGLLYAWLFFPLAFAFYGARPSEYYFNFLLVVCLLVFAVFVSQLKKPIFALGLGFLVAFFVQKSSEQLLPNNLGLYQKDRLVQFVARITKDASAFNLSYNVGLNQDVGFRYLFNYRGVKISGKDTDPLLQVVIPPVESTFTIGLVGLQIPESWISKNWVE